MSGTDHLAATTLERPSAFGLSLSVAQWAAMAGAVTGIAYAFSPLTVMFAVATVPVVRWAGRGVTGVERRWLFTLLGVAIAFRVIAIAALFMTANPDAGTFAKFFGDEELYQLRGLRLYNIWMGIPISQESFLYAYDKTGFSSYMPVLTGLHVFVGQAPYGLHLFNSWLFLFGGVLMYRVVRRPYGSAAALVALTLLLLLPSLFLWSVSALKESLYFAMTGLVLVAAYGAVRARRLAVRLCALAAVLIGAAAIEMLRPGGSQITLAGIALGYAVRVATLRRWTAAAAVAVALLAALWIARDGLPHRVQTQLDIAARYHRGHVFTPGHAFKLLDQRFYSEYWGPLAVHPMTPDETARFLIRATVAFVTVPLPTNVESRAELAFMPEQFVWYLLVLLLPVGLYAGLRRDALLTCVLGGYSAVSAGVVAINSGNVGTLARHRALVIPYLIWISALGLVSWLAARRHS